MSKNYFTKVHQEAIVEYCDTDEQEKREKLYNELIGPVFDELISKIVFTYKFVNMPNIESLKKDCKVHLTTVLNNFDKDKGYKAFSYFTVVTKNWFIRQKKENSKKNETEVNYDDILNLTENDSLVDETSYLTTRESNEFWDTLKDKILEWEKLPDMSEPERAVLRAVKILFNTSENLDILNKKAIYLYLRELTAMDTKELVSNLNKLRERYRVFKQKWDSGEI